MTVVSKEYDAIARRVKIRKDGGDSLHSWALFSDGKMKFNGMDYRQAKAEKHIQICKLLKEKQS